MRSLSLSVLASCLPYSSCIKYHIYIHYKYSSKACFRKSDTIFSCFRFNPAPRTPRDRQVSHARRHSFHIHSSTRIILTHILYTVAWGVPASSRMNSRLPKYMSSKPPPGPIWPHSLSQLSHVQRDSFHTHSSTHIILAYTIYSLMERSCIFSKEWKSD